MGFLWIVLVVVSLTFDVEVHATNTSNVTQFGNFTIEWQNFNILSCAVPNIIGISLFSCLPPANRTQINDISCLQQTTVYFDQTTCQASSTAATIASTSSSGSTTLPMQIFNATRGTTGTTITQTVSDTSSPMITPIASTLTTAALGVTESTTMTTSSVTVTDSSTMITVIASTVSSTTTMTVNISGGVATRTISSTTSSAAQMLINTTSATSDAMNTTRTVVDSTTIVTRTTTTVTASAIIQTYTPSSPPTVPPTRTGTMTTASSTIASTNFTTTISGFLQVMNSSTTQSSSTTTTSTAITMMTTSSLDTGTMMSTTTTAAVPFHCPGVSIGTFCNVSSDPCAMSQPCANAATCFINQTASLGYYCNCQSGFTGHDCQNDERPCKDDTCWNNGTCIVTNATVASSDGANFRCECTEAYNGVHCQLQVSLCSNITCQNNGFCQTTDLIWKCICLDPVLFFGNYCQFQSNALKVHIALSRSFASVAITAITLTCSFIVLMDLLRYVFHIDPVKKERDAKAAEKQAKKAANVTAPRLAVRFQYVA